MTNAIKMMGYITALNLAACATVAESRIENSLKDIGLSNKAASCLSGELEDNLSNKDLEDIADYTKGLAKADTAKAGFLALVKIPNPKAALAISKAGFACTLEDFKE